MTILESYLEILKKKLAVNEGADYWERRNRIWLKYEFNIKINIRNNMIKKNTS